MPERISRYKAESRARGAGGPKSKERVGDDGWKTPERNKTSVWSIGKVGKNSGITAVLR